MFLKHYLLSVVRYLQMTFEQVERFAFYERAKKAFAIVHTGYHYNTLLVFYRYALTCGIFVLEILYMNVLYFPVHYLINEYCLVI